MLHSKSSRLAGGGRRKRSIRSIAATLAAALVVPAAVATVAATPASAAAPRVYVVAGDALVRTGTGDSGGPWSFHHPTDYAELRSIITNKANFGPNGTVKAEFKIGDPIAEPVTAEKLANVDVFFSGAIEGANGDQESYTPAEQDVFRTWVSAGGILIINQNSPGWATGEMYGAEQQDPEAIFESGSVHAGVGGGFEAPNASGGTGAGIPVASTPLVEGPFGTVGAISLWHTVAGFTTLPAGAVTNIRITTPECDDAELSCNYPTTPAQDPLPDPEPTPYNNFIDDLPAVATLTGTGLVGSGAVIFTSDVDVYSSHTEYNGGVMMPENAKLAKNTFAWIADQLGALDSYEGYTPVTPTRILDTRPTGKLGAGGKVDLQVGGFVSGDVTIPADVTGVVLNVTVDQPDAIESYLTVYPTAGAPNTAPNSSNLNFRQGVTIPNMVMVKVGTGGKVTLYNNAGNVDVLADVVGYFRVGTGSRLNSDSPSRVLSTRDGIGSTKTPIGPGESREVQIVGGVVPAGATAVVLNVTATEGTTGGYATVYPANLGTVPGTSNLNFGPNQNIANLAIVQLPTSGASAGKIKVFNASGNTNIIADILGYYSPNGGTFAQIDPARVLDTRVGTGVAVGAVGPNSSIEFSVLGAGGVPTEGVRSVFLNVTAAEPTVGGYLTVYPSDPRPDASNLNFVANQVIPNLVLAQVNSEGKVKIYNEQGSTHVLADVVAWFN